VYVVEGALLAQAQTLSGRHTPRSAALPRVDPEESFEKEPGIILMAFDLLPGVPEAETLKIPGFREPSDQARPSFPVLTR